MRKFVVALMIGVLLFAGTVQAASVSGNAVKTLVSRTLTKVCAANDNRCVRLVSGASETLEKALPALSLIGRTNWLTLALSFLLPVVGDFAFNLGKKIRVYLTKTDEEVIVSSVEKTQAVDIPVAAVPGISSVDGYADEWVSSMQVTLPDPKTLVLTESAGFLASGDSYATGARYVSHIQDAQKYKIGSWNKGDFLEFYTLSNGVFSLTSAEPDYWYFTNDDVVPYYARAGSSSFSVFKGYMSPIVWVKDGVENNGFILIGYDKANSLTVCPQGQAYKYGYGVCEELAESMPDYDQAADANAKMRSEQFATVVTEEPDIPLNEWLDTLTDQEKNAVVSDEFMAAFIDELWKQTAAQDDYEGERYRRNKITPELVSGVASDFPTVGDALETIGTDGTQLTQDRNTGKLHDSTTDPTTPGQGSNPSTTPDAPADTKPGTIGGTNTGTVGDQNINIDVKLDLGDYPDIKQPTLEEPPTAASILDPIFNLFPNLKDYRVPDHASECPRPSFEMFGATFEIDAHCDLLEDQRETVGFIMTLVWSICALWIVLKA
mgnify:CR=1 FL=1